MVTKAFWALVILDGIAAVVLWKLFERGTNGLMLVAYLIVLAPIVLTSAAFPFLRSDGMRIATLIVLLIPSVPLVFSSVAASVRAVQDRRQFSGSAYFPGPALDLAQAMVKHDVGLVQQLIPAAGDLNQPHNGGTTLWQFGVLQADNTEESIDLLRRLLAAGADPKRDTSADTLLHATAMGPELTRFLLAAGANPNVLDEEHRPLWWRSMAPDGDEKAPELLALMLDHGADLTWRVPDGAGPVGHAAAMGYWFVACLLIERGADWKHEKLPEGTLPDLLEGEIIRREEYPIPVPEKLRKVLAKMKGEPMVVPVARAHGADDTSIPDLLRRTSFEQLDQTRAALSRLAQQPDWVRRVAAFFDDGDPAKRGQVALLLSLKPEALPEKVQERCWTVLREQVAWFDRSTGSTKEPKGWLLKETAVIAVGLASIPGSVRERHRADFVALRDRIEQCRKANDPDAAKLADLQKADRQKAD